MRADIHGGQEHKRSVQGPDTEAQDLSPPNHHFPLATRGRSIQMCHNRPCADGAGFVSQTYSIASSARASRAGGMVRPIALAVVRLMTSSNLVGCSTEISAGFAPRKILSTNSAARRNWASMLGP